MKNMKLQVFPELLVYHNVSVFIAVMANIRPVFKNACVSSLFVEIDK
jgi:hypothetical protein